MSKLRITHVLVQPVLTWDDGENLKPGPPCEPVQVGVQDLGELATSLPEQIVELEEKLLAAQAEQQGEAVEPTPINRAARRAVKK